jgi:hypothetical protein
MSEKVAKVFKKIRKNEVNNYICERCDYVCCKKDSYTKHLNTAKHKNNVKCEKVAKVSKEFAKKFECKICDYNTFNKSDYTKHLSTDKHKNKSSSKKENENNLSSTLDPSSNEIKVMTGLMVEIVKSNNELQKQNQDLQKQVLEICQKMQQPSITSNSHNNTTNSHNKTFNLQFFLNEECKDAMNMSEFINSIQLKISDLENIGKVGYVEGISNIIIKELNDTHLNKRPVHCSDVKRETIYIKEENKWEKDTEEAKKMVKAVRDVNKKNYQLLSNWKNTHPACTDSKSQQSEEFTHLVSEVVMDNDEINVKKVVKKVAKQIVIDK